MLGSIQYDGEETSCSYGVWTSQLKHLHGDNWSKLPLKLRYDMTAASPMIMKFGIAYDTMGYPNDWADFMKYRQVVCHELGVDFDGKWFTTREPINYGQLVFLTTLVRHPVERKDPLAPFPRLYEIMVEYGLDPLGALTYATSCELAEADSLAADEDEEEGDKYTGGTSRYDNIAGHGVWGFHHYLMQKYNPKRDPWAVDNYPPVKYYRQLRMVRLWNLLPELKSTIGSSLHLSKVKKVLTAKKYKVPIFQEPAL